MHDLAAQDIRRLYRRVQTAERRVATMRLPGKVAAVDPGKRLLRLKLGESADGRPILSPWSRWQEAAAGGLSIHSQPAIGEQMQIVSQSGTVGQASLAVPATYDQDHGAPSQSTDTAVFERSKGRIELGPDGIRLKGPVHVEGESLTHNGVDVGDDHEHTEVTKGDDLTGPPQG